jgi:membrane protease YdiL (CAAX protease family)
MKSLNIKNLTNWKLYFTLLTASAFSVAAILPYIITVQADVLKAAPIPLPVVILASVIQSLFLFAIIIFVGLRISRQLGLQAPFLEKLLAGEKPDTGVKSVIKLSVSLGSLSGVIMILLDSLLFSRLGIGVLFEQISVPIWKGFLASFYGGITEEILMRLFFMTFILWIISKIIRIKGNVLENNLVMWSSIIIATLLFGIGHLPITATLTALTPMVVIRALVLNGIGGLVFGWLYWKKGLEAAMIAHFSTDMIIYVCLPAISLLM